MIYFTHILKKQALKLSIVLFCIALIVPAISFSKPVHRKLDSLTNCLNSTKSDSQKIFLLNDIAAEYFKSLPDTSRLLLQKALSLSEQINFQAGTAKTYNNLAILSRYCGNYESALDLISLSLKIYETEKDLNGKANCYDNLGVIHMEQGLYSKALDLFLKSVQLHEKLSDKKGIAYTLGNLGIVYKLQGDYERAFENFSKSLSLNEQTGDLKGIAKAHNLLGSIYSVQKQYDEAILCYRKSYKMSNQASDKYGMAFSMEYIADVFQSRKKYLKALGYNLESMKLRQELGNNTGIAQNLYKIGNIYFLMKDFKLAEKNILNSIEISKKLNLSNLLQSSYNILSELYFQKGEYKKSSEFFRNAKQLSDTINNIQNAKKITQLVMNIEFNKKQKKNEIREKKRELIQLQEKNKQIIFKNIFIAGFLFVIILVLILFRNYRIKTKNNNALLHKNEEINRKNEEILLQTAKLEHNNQELEKLSIVARETESAILIANIQGLIEWVNLGFTKLYGYTLYEFITEQGANILKASSNPDIHDAIFECVCKKNSVTYICKTKKRSGETLWVQTTLTPILDDDGNVIKMVAIDSDITKIKQAEKKIIKQTEALQSHREMLVKFNKELEKKNLQILDSIEYAKHIQDAILLTNDDLNRIFTDSFVFFKPRDIVSGDFYWATQQNGKTYVAVIDCIGHGVSGAFMSMLGYAFLTEIINKVEDIKANEVLSILRENIVVALGKVDKQGGLKYGMDMALCIIDHTTNSLQFSGANSPIYLIKKCQSASECLREVTVDMHKITHLSNVTRNGHDYHLIEVKASKFPIGVSRKGMEPFVNNEFKMESGDMLYLFTDGFFDQFGGEEGWKFMASNFKKMILEIFDKPVSEQKYIFENTYETWTTSQKGKHAQTDDITIMGIKF